jgi:hypothetical protein
VTVEYSSGRAVRVDYVVIAASHTPDVVSRDGKYTTEEAKQEIIAKDVNTFNRTEGEGYERIQQG